MLKDKVALVTGSSCGIGKAILLALADHGYKVILHCFKSCNKTNRLVKDLKLKGVDISVYPCDLTKEKEVSKLFKKIKNKYHKLDILINNVGNYLKKPLEKLKPNEWHRIINSNLNLTYYCIHYSLPLIRKSKKGRIINIGYASTGQITAKPQILPYQIAKTGILLMTKAYALTEAKNKILINMISPGVMENSVHFPKKEIPLKKQGSLNELAKLVIQTLENKYITGAHIEYAGGFNL